MFISGGRFPQVNPEPKGASSNVPNFAGLIVGTGMDIQPASSKPRRNSQAGSRRSSLQQPNTNMFSGISVVGSSVNSGNSLYSKLVAGAASSKTDSRTFSTKLSPRKDTRHCDEIESYRSMGPQGRSLSADRKNMKSVGIKSVQGKHAAWTKLEPQVSPRENKFAAQQAVQQAKDRLKIVRQRIASQLQVPPEPTETAQEKERRSLEQRQLALLRLREKGPMINSNDGREKLREQRKKMKDYDRKVKEQLGESIIVRERAPIVQTNDGRDKLREQREKMKEYDQKVRTQQAEALMVQQTPEWKAEQVANAKREKERKKQLEKEAEQKREVNLIISKQAMEQARARAQQRRKEQLVKEAAAREEVEKARQQKRAEADQAKAAKENRRSMIYLLNQLKQTYFERMFQQWVVKLAEKRKSSADSDSEDGEEDEDDDKDEDFEEGTATSTVNRNVTGA
mmetsp:Transcript_30193/g.59103  ORF Transcript_30193/g.59103 Transcript_30193/m.59103 type:complete len:454 (-) Transcript_30193:28-1389(-)